MLRLFTWDMAGNFMDKPLWGLRVQAPFGARVQKVQRVQRVEVGASKL